VILENARDKSRNDGLEKRRFMNRMMSADRKWSWPKDCRKAGWESGY
jgi:hypothetical protein